MGWPFFHTLVDFMQTTLAKATCGWRALHVVSNPTTRGRLWTRITEEHADCVQAILLITVNENLGGSPVYEIHTSSQPVCRPALLRSGRAPASAPRTPENSQGAKVS